MNNIFKAISKAGFTVTLLFSTITLSNTNSNLFNEKSNDCQLFAKNSKSNQFNIHIGSGVLLKENKNIKLNNIILDGYYFAMTRHQLFNEGFAGRSESIEQFDFQVHCSGNVTFTLVTNNINYKEISKCKVNELIYLSDKSMSFVNSGCDLGVYKVKEVIEGDLNKTKTYSINVDKLKGQEPKHVALKLFDKTENKHKLILCNVKVWGIGASEIFCERKGIFSSVNANNLDYFKEIGLTSGSVILAVESKKLIQDDGSNVAIGVLKDFKFDDTGVTILAENWKVTKIKNNNDKTDSIAMNISSSK